MSEQKRETPTLQDLRLGPEIHGALSMFSRDIFLLIAQYVQHPHLPADLWKQLLRRTKGIRNQFRRHFSIGNDARIEYNRQQGTWIFNTSRGIGIRRWYSVWPEWVRRHRDCYAQKASGEFHCPSWLWHGGDCLPHWFEIKKGSRDSYCIRGVSGNSRNPPRYDKVMRQSFKRIKT